MAYLLHVIPLGSGHHSLRCLFVRMSRDQQAWRAVIRRLVAAEEISQCMPVYLDG
jgi:hypothetical protein